MDLGLWIGARVDDSAHGAKIVTRGIDTPSISFALRHSWYVDRKILRIGMCRDKIQRQMIVLTVAEKVVDPYGDPWDGEWIDGMSGRSRLVERFTIHIEVAR